MALLRRCRAEAPAYRVHARGVNERSWRVTTDAPGRPRGAGAVPHRTRITVADGLVTALRQDRADAATV